jgi:predicted hotdog family 3-hydroxylacyl-ACP dehydratase
MNADENILSLIPQRLPFVMVDRVLYADEFMTRTAFRIREDNVLVEDGRLREPGLVENIAQTAAAGAGLVALRENRTVAVAYIGVIRNLEIPGLPEVGEELMTEVWNGEKVFEVVSVSGKVWCGERLLAQCEMKLFPQ